MSAQTESTSRFLAVCKAHGLAAEDEVDLLLSLIAEQGLGKVLDEWADILRSTTATPEVTAVPAVDLPSPIATAMPEASNYFDRSLRRAAALRTPPLRVITEQTEMEVAEVTVHIIVWPDADYAEAGRLLALTSACTTPWDAQQILLARHAMLSDGSVLVQEIYDAEMGPWLDAYLIHHDDGNAQPDPSAMPLKTLQEIMAFTMPSGEQWLCRNISQFELSVDPS